jgi:hypothetical protein
VPDHSCLCGRPLGSSLVRVHIYAACSTPRGERVASIIRDAPPLTLPWSVNRESISLSPVRRVCLWSSQGLQSGTLAPFPCALICDSLSDGTMPEGDLHGSPPTWPLWQPAPGRHRR